MACLFDKVPAYRVRAIEALGAEVHIVGDTQDDAVAEAIRLSGEEGLQLTHPFEAPESSPARARSPWSCSTRSRISAR